MIHLAISGCLGKMGGRIATLAVKDNHFKIVAATEIKGHSKIGADLGETLGLGRLGVYVCDEPQEAIKKCDCLIEFTSPEATLKHLKVAHAAKKAMVIGTTGLSDAQKKEIEQAAKKIPIVYSPNMSIAVNLLFSLVKEAAQKLGAEYQVDIVEAHHVHKKDAPSGTAKHLAQIIQNEKAGREIPIKSIREGEIIGDHKITFSGPFDTLELSHSAKTRDIFAAGALVAAKFIVRKKSGLYSMLEVINQK